MILTVMSSLKKYLMSDKIFPDSHSLDGTAQKRSRYATGKLVVVKTHRET